MIAFNRKEDLILTMTPGKHDETSVNSKYSL